MNAHASLSDCGHRHHEPRHLRGLQATGRPVDRARPLFGGRYVARGGQREVLERDWEPHRLVVLEFPDMATLKAWYDSPEYAPIKQIRENSAKGRLIALEGL